MSIDFHAVRSVPEDADASIVLVTTESFKAGFEGIGADSAMLDSTSFKGKADQVYSQPSGGRVLGLVGLGLAVDVTADTLRRAGAAIARAWQRHARVAVTVGGTDDICVDVAEIRQALAEGVVLGKYRYTAFKSKSTKNGSSDDTNPDADDEPRLRRVDVVGDDSESAAFDLAKGSAVASGVCLARDLVNEPGGSLTPPVFARRAAAIAREAGLRAEVWDKQRIEQERLGGLLGVNRGSAQPPRFVHISYQPSTEGGAGDGTAEGGAGDGTAEGGDEQIGTPALALVGKGLTFDAGGLSIKPAQGMMTMKMDMAGAAAVIGAMSVLPVIAPKTAVHAYLPMTDNMLGGDATRPGDVLTIRNGKTIEVANTDAEGRLVLADALSLASESKPDAILDLATLTGACVIALGPRIAGLMGNDESWISQVRSAADTAGERVWPLPLPVDYEKQFKSDVADMKNIGTAHGGALTAGLILQKFIADKIPWAHLDIAGPAFSDSEDGEICKGGTGFGVRTLIGLIDGFAESEAAASSRAR